MHRFSLNYNWKEKKGLTGLELEDERVISHSCGREVVERFLSDR